MAFFRLKAEWIDHLEMIGTLQEYPPSFLGGSSTTYYNDDFMLNFTPPGYLCFNDGTIVVLKEGYSFDLENHQVVEV